MEKILDVKIMQRRDTEANWQTSDPILLKNEIAYSSDKNDRYKIGNGTSKWSALSYNKADPVSHTHTKSQITDFPTSLKNPSALTIQGNGMTLTNGTYDGSAAKTVNITPSAIGAATSVHSHTKSQITDMPTSLKNPYALNINGVAYDGSSAKDIDLLPFIVGTQTAATGSWKGAASTISALTDGLTIRYWLPYAGSGNATLNLTLSDGTETGAINCYYGGTTRLTTHYTAGSIITLTYRSGVSIAGSTATYTGWWADANYDSGNTRNTAGSTDTSSKIFLIGATSQAANPQTYSHDTAYVGTDGCLYSNNVQVVNLSDTQALTNKTYNGYALASACAKTAGNAVGNVPIIGTALGTTANVPVVTNTSGQLIPHTSGALGTSAFKPYTDSSSASAIGTGTSLVTERDVYYGLPSINGNHTYTSSTSIFAPTVAGTSGSILKSAGSGAPTWVAQSELSAGTASKLTTARTINGTSFDGTANITTANWGTARNIYIADSDGTNTGAAVSVNGSANVTLKLPATIKGSLSGNSTTTSKWITARTITAAGDMTGSCSIDGSANVTMNLYPYYCRGSVGNTNNYPYHRIAKIDKITSSYSDKVMTFLITQDYNGGHYGIARVGLRTNSGTTVSSVEVQWLVRKGFAVDALQAAIYNVFGETYCDLFYKSNGTYCSIVVRNLGSGARGSVSRTWTLIDSSEANNTTTTDALTSTECYASIEAAGTALHEQNYSTTVSGSDVGIVNVANSTTKLTTARTINGTSFNGTANITTANWGTARNIYISDSDGTNTGSAVSVNGAANATLKLPATIKATLSGNATTATTATKLGSSTVGGTAKPIYLNSGTATACSSTVGSTDTPVYMNAGTITSTGKSFSSYLPLAGGTMTGTINSSKTTGTYLAGNQGQTIINSTAASGSYTMLAKMNSTNGYFTHGTYGNKYLLQYTAKITVDSGANGATKSITLLDEDGNSVFPGTVTMNALLLPSVGIFLGSSKRAYIYHETTDDGNILFRYTKTAGGDYAYTNIRSLATSFIPLAGSTAITGVLQSSAEIKSSSANAFRACYGNYGFIIRNDGSSTYFLLTNSGSAVSGAFNSLRPLYINNSTGQLKSETGFTIDTASTSNAEITVKCSTTRSGKLVAGDGGNFGLYDITNNKWTLKSTSDGTVTVGSHLVVPTATNACRPDADNAFQCGSSEYRFTKVYATTGSIQTSDERDKDIISKVDDTSIYKNLFMNLESIIYKWKDTRTDDKIHIGVGAQTTEQKAIDCGIDIEEIGMIDHDYWDTPSKDGRTDRYGMNYNEIAALTVPIVQDHERKLTEATEEIANQNKIITQLMEEIELLKGQLIK